MKKICKAARYKIHRKKRTDDNLGGRRRYLFVYLFI